MKCCTPKCSIITIVIGCILCIGSGLFLFFLPPLIDNIVAMESELTTTSIAYTMWQQIPVPVFRQFYAFNYSNYEDFLDKNGTIKPIVTQMGPYTYQEIRNKVFLDWESNGDYVQYRETHNFVFRPDMSPGLNEDDFVWTPNLPLMSTCDLVRRMYPAAEASIMLRVINQVVTNQSQDAFVKMTVGQLLFYGYHDKVLEFAQAASQQEFLPGSYYAMFYGINATDDGKYEVNRGYDDISQLYKIKKWNESTSINLWSMDQPNGNETGCNMYNGTDGSFYWPGIERKDRVNIFISSICRSVFMEYIEDAEFNGITGYRYASNVKLFADPNMNPDNYCYCSPNASACIASGVSAFGPCKFGSPIYLSHPHFLYTDYAIKDAIDGLAPDESQHRIVVSVEPNSGNLMRIDVRFQINLRMFYVEEIEKLQHLPEMILMPLVWINESSQLDQDRVDLIHDSLYLPMNAAYGIAYALISLTGFMIIVGVLCAFNLMFRFKKYATDGSLQPTAHSNDYPMSEKSPNGAAGRSSNSSPMYDEANLPRVKAQYPNYNRNNSKGNTYY